MLLASSSLDQLRARFVHHDPGTVGIEEELMVLDAETFDLRPAGASIVAAALGDPRFTTELPAAQVEIVLPPATSVDDVARSLHQARRHLAAHASSFGAVLAGAGVHPFASPLGELNGGARYDTIAREFAGVARRQLVFGLHVHVSLDGPDETLAVYNAVREHLPALAALAGNAPYYEGVDSGLASVRPKLNDLLPRQGVPPELRSWDEVVAMYDWGRRSGAVPEGGQWWWEARLHPTHGTLEVRVCDTQATVRDTVALVAVVRGLVLMLAERHRSGALPSPAPSWRIDENRWSACRHGTRGRWFDVRAGASCAMADHLHGLLDELAAYAPQDRLIDARDLIDQPRPARLRQEITRFGIVGAVRRLAGALVG